MSGRTRNAEIYHTTGYKNPWLVVVEFDEPRKEWKPKNDKIFEWIDHWFQAEEEEYGFYGDTMAWWYITMLWLGEDEIAHEAAKNFEGDTARDHLEQAMAENYEEVAERIMNLGERAEMRQNGNRDLLNQGDNNGGR
jgi:hypothetical protein